MDGDRTTTLRRRDVGAASVSVVRPAEVEALYLILSKNILTRKPKVSLVFLGLVAFLDICFYFCEFSPEGRTINIVNIVRGKITERGETIIDKNLLIRITFHGR